MLALAAADVDVLTTSFAAAVGAALLAGALRGFSGFGSALVLAPSLSALYSPATAVPVALLLELALSVPFVPPALRLVDGRRVGVLCAAALVTIPLGAWLLAVVDERPLRWAICAAVLAAVAIIGFGWRYHGRPHAAAAVATGALSGLLGGSTGLSGPPVLFLYLSGTDPVARMRASFIVFFAWVDVVALVAFAVGGTLGSMALALAGALLVPYVAAALVGARLFEGSSEAFYRRLAVAVLLSVAVVSLPL
jgi:uncharacterized membrane protein YfcA